MAREERLEWESQLAQILVTKPAEVVQEACQVLGKHDYPENKELKSELYLLVPLITWSAMFADLHVFVPKEAIEYPYLTVTWSAHVASVYKFCEHLSM